MKDKELKVKTLEVSESADVAEKKGYIKPDLKKLGDLRALTLGGSPQTFTDSSFGPYI